MPPAFETFDVFDTVLTRNVGDPHAIFLCVAQAAQERPLPVGDPVKFKRLRVEAETLARKTCGRNDTTLREIYDQLASLLGLTSAQARELEQIEMEVEEAALRPVKLMASSVSEARTRHGSVAFLSDMYLPAEFLEAKLRESGLFENGDQLWVSGERNATKFSGDLYRAFLNQTGLPPQNLRHCGDNPASDVRVPAGLGIRTVHFDSCILNRYEQILERFSDETDAFSSYFAGASRLVRVSTANQLPKAGALRDVAAGVAGPALLSYVLWILKRATQLRLKRVYFLARDGQILLELARLAAPVVGFTGDLRYLYASRQAFRLPTADLADPASLQWSLDDTTFMSLDSFLARLDLTIAEVEEPLRRCGISSAEPAKNLDRAARQKLPALTDDARFRRAVARVAQTRRHMLVQYLAQEQVIGADNFGIVDLGWNGTLQISLERILKDRKGVAPTGFYFGLSRKALDSGLEKCEAYFFDEGRRTGFVERDYWIQPMLEVFCSANHGTTLGFESTNGRIAPTLKSPHNESALAWGLAIQQAAILEFGRLALENFRPSFDPQRLRPAIHALLGEFWNSPTPAEVAAWGTYPYADDQTEACKHNLSEPFKVKDWLRSVYRGKMTPPHRAGWIAGGLMLSAAPIRWTLPKAVETVSRIHRLYRR
jgi:FMN phosphatase YigB (HAD superfamily)